MSRISLIFLAVAAIGLLVILGVGRDDPVSRAQHGTSPERTPPSEALSGEAESANSDPSTRSLKATTTHSSSSFNSASRPRLPDHENGYAVLARAAAAFQQIEGLDVGEMALKVSADDVVRLREFLALNAKVLTELREAIRLERGQVPEITSFSDPIPELSALRPLGHLLKAQAIVDLADGLTGSAVTNLHDHEKYGVLVLSSEGVLIHNMVGVAILWEGRQEKQELLQLEGFTNEMLELYGDQLKPVGGVGGVIEEAWKVSLTTEARVAHSEMTKISKEGMPPEFLDMLNGPANLIPLSMKEVMGRPENLRRIFDLEETLELYDVLIAHGIRSMEVDSHEKALGEFAKSDRLLKERATLSLESWSKEGENPVGRLMVASMLPNLSSIRKKLTYIQMEESAQAIEVAVKLHRALYASLPDTLDELVPHFLGDKPVDPWNGKPISYDRKKVTVTFAHPDEPKVYVLK